MRTKVLSITLETWHIYRTVQLTFRTNFARNFGVRWNGGTGLQGNMEMELSYSLRKYCNMCKFFALLKSFWIIFCLSFRFFSFYLFGWWTLSSSLKCVGVSAYGSWATQEHANKIKSSLANSPRMLWRRFSLWSQSSAPIGPVSVVAGQRCVPLKLSARYRVPARQRKR